MLWHLRIGPAESQIDTEGFRVSGEASTLHLPGPWKVAASRGFLLEGNLSRHQLETASRDVLVDPVVERFEIHECGAGDPSGTVVHVLRKPGVTDPEADSARSVLRDLGLDVEAVRTIRSYRLDGPADGLAPLIRRVLANDAVEQAVTGRLHFDRLGQGEAYEFPQDHRAVNGQE